MYNQNLRQLEKKAFTSFFQDGLIDLFVGFSFVLYGLLMVLNWHPFVSLAFLPIIFIWPMKKQFTVPRMGMVRFSQKRYVKISKTALVSLVLGMAVFVFALFLSTHQSLADYRLFLLGFCIGFLPLMGALLTGIFRYLFYAPLLSLTFILERYIPGSYPWNFLILGLVIMFIGLVLFNRFLHQYPIPEGDE